MSRKKPEYDPFGVVVWPQFYPQLAEMGITPSTTHLSEDAVRRLRQIIHSIDAEISRYQSMTPNERILSHVHFTLLQGIDPKLLHQMRNAKTEQPYVEMILEELGKQRARLNGVLNPSKKPIQMPPHARRKKPAQPAPRRELGSRKRGPAR